MSRLMPLLLCGLAVCGAGVCRAQNASNYFVLTNGADAAFIGIGAGGTQTAADGLGTFIAGEDLKGARRTPLGDFGFRMPSFTENACVFTAPAVGTPTLRFPSLTFTELDGLNGNVPEVFTNPTCSQPSFPLGASGAVPYGTPPGSSASFVLAALPSGAGTATIVLPNNGLAPTPVGTATIIGAASASLPIASTGFCWAVTFQWNPSSLTTLDDIDGLWHYAVNSPDGNQYWAMSSNEQNIWQSQTVGTDGGVSTLIGLPANVDYALEMRSADPATVATLAPRPGDRFANQTFNVNNEFGTVLNPNGGFDAGRGSSAISFSGNAGVANPNTGLGNQNPAAGAPVTTLGFATWDNGGDHNGSVRLTWLSLDFLGALGGKPETDPGITKQGGTVRLPVVTAGVLQPLTGLAFGVYGHVTRPGFPFGIGGASWQIPTGPHPTVCVGIPVNLTYGTSGRKGNIGHPGALTFNQSIAATGSTRQLFLFD
jgi:hypothetical protein